MTTSSSRFASISQIISWANPTGRVHEINFLGKRPELPYIKRGDLFFYFKLAENHEYILLMSSLHDLESM